MQGFKRLKISRLTGQRQRKYNSATTSSIALRLQRSRDKASMHRPLYSNQRLSFQPERRVPTTSISLRRGEYKRRMVNRNGFTVRVPKTSKTLCTSQQSHLCIKLVPRKDLRMTPNRCGDLTMRDCLCRRISRTLSNPNESRDIPIKSGTINSTSSACSQLINPKKQQ